MCVVVVVIGEISLSDCLQRAVSVCAALQRESLAWVVSNDASPYLRAVAFTRRTQKHKRPAAQVECCMLVGGLMT